MTIARFPARTAAWLVLLAAACSANDDRDQSIAAGAPLSNLTEGERGRFLLGKAVFERLTTPEEGLGPLYNETRCSACHQTPVSGGTGDTLVIKATRFEDGSCDLLVDQGGDNIQQLATALLVSHGMSPEVIPDAATAHVRVTGPPLFGLGLVDAIPAETIRALEDPNDEDGDGISGRAGRAADGRLGRFGRKGESATVFDFVETALRFELGLTTPMNPVEETVNGVPVPADADPMAEPEIDERGMNLLTDFIRFLAPPSRFRPASEAARDSVEQGERLFEEIGCAACHVPSMTSGSSDVAALSRQPVEAYSDWLLHDMGPESADVCGGIAEPAEYRTAPLWGLSARQGLFMHHGRARNLREATMMHEGESAGSRDAFSALDPSDQAMVIAFMSSL